MTVSGGPSRSTPRGCADEDLDLNKLDDLCTDVCRELQEIDTPEALEVEALVLERMETVRFVAEGLCVELELLPTLQAEHASVEKLIERARGQALALLAARRVAMPADASANAVNRALETLKDAGVARTILHRQLSLALDLRTDLEVQLRSVRSAAAGPKDARAKLDEALARARKLLRQKG